MNFWWLLPWGLLLGAIGLAVRAAPERVVWRWWSAALALLAPLICPERGFVSTIVTTWAVILGVRLFDLAALSRPRPRSLFEKILWLTLPVVRRLPDSAAQRRLNRARSVSPLCWALAERLAWELLDRVVLPALAAHGTGPLRSFIAILFFVLNFAALAHAVMASCLLLGCDVEPVFDSPLLSRSPREFWSRRWNKFIARFLLKHVALALSRGLPPAVVVGAVFAASGLLHEYFVLGAGGWGPTHAGGYMLLFFSLQGVVVFLETRFGPTLPRLPGVLLTFAWMVLTAPLFFRPLTVPLLAFGYPAAWLP